MSFRRMEKMPGALPPHLLAMTVSALGHYALPTCIECCFGVENHLKPTLHDNVRARCMTLQLQQLLAIVDLNKDA